MKAFFIFTLHSFRRAVSRAAPTAGMSKPIQDADDGITTTIDEG